MSLFKGESENRKKRSKKVFVTKKATLRTFGDGKRLNGWKFVLNVSIYTESRNTCHGYMKEHSKS